MAMRFTTPAAGIMSGVLLLGGCRDRDSLRRAPERVEIEVTGSGFQWEIRYQGFDGRFGTADDVVTQKNLRLPVGVPVRLHLRSDDFLYGLLIPKFDLNEIAVPDIESSVEFVSDETGEFDLRGNQMCGFTHPGLLGTVTVVPADEFWRWLGGDGRERPER